MIVERGRLVTDDTHLGKHEINGNLLCCRLAVCPYVRQFGLLWPEWHTSLAVVAMVESEVVRARENPFHLVVRMIFSAFVVCSTRVSVLWLVRARSAIGRHCWILSRCG